MAPTVGRIVHYRVPEHLNSQTALMKSNGVKSSDILPAIIVRVWNEPDSPHADLINLQVFTDCGPMVPATSVHEGDQPGQWSFPPRV